jgi:cytochrome P450
MTDTSPESTPETTTPEVVLDPQDQARTKNWDLLDHFRETDPVLRAAPGVLFTTRYADTAAVFRDAKRFSSVGDMRAPGVVIDDDERFLGEIDAPLHPKIRRLLLRGFTLAGARDAEPWTRASVRRRLAAVDAAGEGDLMEALAVPLPGSVAAHVLGIPDEQHDQMMTWCNELLHSTWVSHGETERGTGLAGAFPEMSAAIDALIAERRDADGPPTDLLGVMVRTKAEDGWHIPEAHVRTLTVNILAGSLSARYMIGNLLHRYLTHGDDFAEVLRRDRTLIPAAVDESLRHEAPVMHLFRTAQVDTEIGGCPVRAGEHVMVGIGAGNRDGSVYPDPTEFRLDREGQPEHLSFGVGPHLCLGNHLTRMVGAVVLEEVLDRFGPDELQLAPGYTWVCVDHPLEYGPETLEVVVSR